MKAVKAIEILLPIQAGLQITGVDDDGYLEWVGPDKAWRKLDILSDDMHDCKIGNGDGHCDHPSHPLI